MGGGKGDEAPVAEIELGEFEEAPGLGISGHPGGVTLTRVVVTDTPAEAGTAASAKAEAVNAKTGA